MAKFQVVNGKMVKVEEMDTLTETTAKAFVEQLLKDVPQFPPARAQQQDIEAELEQQLQSEQPEASAESVEECTKCKAWYTPAPGLPDSICAKCYNESRPNSNTGTPFDNYMKTQLATSEVTVYAPSIEQIREFFNLEVEGHGIHPDHEFIRDVLGHTFIKPVKDCSLDEAIMRVEKYEKLIFELQARTRGTKINIRQRAKDLSDKDKERVKALDGEYRPESAVAKAKKERVTKPKVANKKTALDSLRVVYSLQGMSPAEVDAALKAQFPTLFEA